MKKLVVTIGLLAGATVAYSQGTINWSDYIGANPGEGLPAFAISVWSPGPGGAEQNLGNSPNSLNGDNPSGTASYSGVLIGGTGSGSGATGYGNGSDYDIGLYAGTSAAAAQAAVASGTPSATANFSAGGGGWDFTGALDSPLAGFAAKSSVFVELAAWYNGGATGAGLGSITSYAAAVAAQDPAGTSVVSGSPVQASAYTSATGGEVSLGGGSPAATAGTLAGLGITDFSLATSTPEPSTIALGVVGASAFLMRLRRKV